MRPRLLCLIAGLLAVSACEPAPPPPEDVPEFAEAFRDLPLPARAQVVSREGSRDALQIVLAVPALPGTVARMYRASLSANPWRLVSDSEDSTGTIVLYAEGRSPLWVRIAAGDSGWSRVELNGAVPGRDSAYVRQRQGAADTINTMRPRSIRPPPGP